MFVSTVLAERLVKVCDESGASQDERLAALQIAMTLIMRGFKSSEEDMKIGDSRRLHDGESHL